MAQVQKPPAALRVHDSTVVLPDGRSFVAGLQQLRAHGLLGSKGEYVVLSGFGCEDCDAVRSVYVMRVGERLDWNKQPSPPVFAYPGTTRDTENKVVARSRLFFGQCGNDSTPTVIQFARTQRSGKWTDSIHVAALRADSLVTSSEGHTGGRLDQVLARVQKGECLEVTPNQQQVEP